MENLIGFVVGVYVVGIALTVIWFVFDWSDARDYNEAKERHYARQVVFAPLWPRYAIPAIKKVPAKVVAFVSAAIQLVKDAFK